MRIFRQSYKINFCDRNDVLVGFDYEGSCCEEFGYFFSAGKDTKASDEHEHIDEKALPEGLVFDTEFFNEKEEEAGFMHEGAMATFRLYKPSRVRGDRAMREQERQQMADGDLTEVFLTLFNWHNGYYGHGFSFTVGDKTIQEGCL